MILLNFMAIVMLALSMLTSVGLVYADEGEVLASMGNHMITREDARVLFANQDAGTRQKLTENPSLLADFLRNEVMRRAIVAESIASGLESDPRVLFLIEQHRNQILIDSYLSKMTQLPEAYPDASEIGRYYLAHVGDYKLPAMVRLAQIYVPVSDKSPDALQKEANKKIFTLFEKVKSKQADFFEVARDNPQNPELDGEPMGWVPDAILQPEIKAKVAVLDKLPKGTVGRPVKTPYGWYIVQLMDSKSEKNQTLAEATPAIVNLLRSKLLKEKRRAYLLDLFAKSPATIAEPAALKRFLIQKE